MLKSNHGCVSVRIDLSSNFEMGKQLAGVSIRSLGTCVSSHMRLYSVKWMFCINSVFFPSHVIISSFQLVLRCDVAAGRHGPADVGEGGRRVPGEGLRHYPGGLRPLRSRGLQGQPLHHQQDPAGRSDQIPDRWPDVHWSPFPPQLLQAALPGHHAPHQARPQEGREGRRQIRLRRQRKCSFQTKIQARQNREKNVENIVRAVHLSDTPTDVLFFSP